AATMFVVDEFGVVLSLAEAILLLAALPSFLYAAFTICRDGLLHANFRLLLCVFMSRSVLITIRRLPTLYWRVFIVGEEEVPFISWYLLLAGFTTNLLITSLVVLSLERLLRTHVKCFTRRGLMSSLIVLCALLISQMSLHVLNSYIKEIWYPISTLTLAPVVAFVIISGLSRENRHYDNNDLSRFFRESPDIELLFQTVRTFLPPLFFSTLITVSSGLVLFVQFYFMHQERSGDSKLNNVYGLVSAIDALGTPLLVILRHKHFLHESSKRIAKDIQQKFNNTQAYFKQLKNEW
ncbi:hypothetical protein PMAYCL1PPCAC_16426, partial [Pristionchus mayeri]